MLQNPSQLQRAADEIRQWHTETNMQLEQKDYQLDEAKRTIDNLRTTLHEVNCNYGNIHTQLQEEITLRGENERKLEATKNMCMLIQGETKELHDTFRHYEQSLQCFIDEDAKKMDTIKSLEEIVKNLSEECDRVKEKFERQVKEIQEEHDDKLLKMQSTMEIKQKQVQKLKAELASTSDELNKMDNLNQNLISNIKDLEEKKKVELEKLHNEILTIKGHLNGKERDISNQKSISENFLHEIEVLRQNLQKERNEFIDFKQKHEETLIKHKEEINLIDEKMKGVISSKSVMEANLQNDLREKEIKIKSSDSLIVDLQSQNNNFQMQSTYYLKQIEENEINLKSLQNKLDTKSEETAQLKTLNNIAKEENKKHEAKITELESQIKELRRCIEKNDEKQKEKDDNQLSIVEELKKVNLEIENKLNNVLEENDILKKKNAEVQSEKDNISSEYDIIKLKQEEYLNELNQSKESLSTVNEHNVKYQQMLKEEIDKVQKLNDEVASSKAEVAMLSKDLKELNLLLSKKDNEMEELSKTVKQRLKKKDMEILEIKSSIKKALSQKQVPQNTEKNETKLDATPFKYSHKENRNTLKLPNSSCRSSRSVKRPKIDFDCYRSPSEININVMEQKSIQEKRVQQSQVKKERIIYPVCSSTPKEGQLKSTNKKSIVSKPKSAKKGTALQSKRLKKHEKEDSILNDSVWGFFD